MAIISCICHALLLSIKVSLLWLQYDWVLYTPQATSYTINAHFLKIMALDQCMSIGFPCFWWYSKWFCFKSAHFLLSDYKICLYMHVHTKSFPTRRDNLFCFCPMFIGYVFMSSGVEWHMPWGTLSSCLVRITCTPKLNRFLLPIMRSMWSWRLTRTFMFCIPKYYICWIPLDLMKKHLSNDNSLFPSSLESKWFFILFPKNKINLP